MKRHTPRLRGIQEIKADNDRAYSEILKHPSKINPVFTGKPYVLGQIESKVKIFENAGNS